MPNPESRFTSNLRKDMSKIHPAVYTLKVMTYGNNGVPDMYASAYPRDIWVELKWITLPKREDTRITPNLSSLQLNWLLHRELEDRNVCVIIGSKEGCCIMHTSTIHWSEEVVRTDFHYTRKEVAQWLINQIYD